MKFKKINKIKVEGGVVSALDLDEFYEENKELIEQIVANKQPSIKPKIAVYPGSFNPWHEGHADILSKALKVFDEVIISAGINPEKVKPDYDLSELVHCPEYLYKDGASPRVSVIHFGGLLADFIKGLKDGSRLHGRTVQVDAIIRGLRNGHDLQYEMNQQYWNEDLGLDIPVVYFICDRKLSHISSSIIRSLKKFRNENDG